jgi:hypothetical protein
MPAESPLSTPLPQQKLENDPKNPGFISTVGV